MTVVAIIAVALAVGAWAGIRWSEATRLETDISTYIASIPADEWRQP